MSLQWTLHDWRLAWGVSDMCTRTTQSYTSQEATPRKQRTDFDKHYVFEHDKILNQTIHVWVGSGEYEIEQHNEIFMLDKYAQYILHTIPHDDKVKQVCLKLLQIYDK